MAIIKYRESPTAEWQELPVVNKVSIGYLPEEALTITGDCQYRFANSGWDWFIENYGDQVTTKDITEASYMFKNCSALTEIPFDLHFAPKDNSNDNNVFELFNGCKRLRSLPRLTGKKASVVPTYYPYFMDLKELFRGCTYLREIPDYYLNDFVPEGYWEARRAKGAEGSGGNAFHSCCSLRRIGQGNLLPFGHFYNGSEYMSMYNNLYLYCHALDEINNIPVEPGTYSSNHFNDTFYDCYRLKQVTFELQEDGTPYAAKWKNQYIVLSSWIGWARAATAVTNYNSGITADKEVKDDATYAALKNDPDWFTCDMAYSRYNHDSAVATINSLPDASAYLATAGGSNIIRFTGAAGSKTDGGAINTLTDAEIAVAAAKGWTVTLI